MAKLYRPSQRANVLVTLEDGHIKKWTGRTCRSIQKSARAHYAGQKLAFGRCWYATR